MMIPNQKLTMTLKERMDFMKESQVILKIGGELKEILEKLVTITIVMMTNQVEEKCYPSLITDLQNITLI